MTIPDSIGFELNIGLPIFPARTVVLWFFFIIKLSKLTRVDLPFVPVIAIILIFSGCFF